MILRRRFWQSFGVGEGCEDFEIVKVHNRLFSVEVGISYSTLLSTSSFSLLRQRKVTKRKATPDKPLILIPTQFSSR